MGNRTKRSYCQYGRTSAPSLSSKYHQATLQCLAVIAHWALPKKANGGRARAAVQVATSSTHPGGVDRGDLASRHRRGKGEKRRGRRAAARPRASHLHARPPEAIRTERIRVFRGGWTGHCEQREQTRKQDHLTCALPVRGNQFGKSAAAAAAKTARTVSVPDLTL